MLEAIEDPNGGTLTLGYDGEGRLTQVTNALGRRYALERDAAGRVVAEVDFDGRVTRYTRDVVGRVSETVRPDGARLVYGYDRTGLVTGIQVFGPDGRRQDQVAYGYDRRGLLVEARNEATRVEYIRDRDGRIVEEDVGGRRVQSRYDACGRRVARRIFSGIDQPYEVRLGEHVTRQAYDPLGALSELIIAEHAPLGFTRDGLGREVRRESAAGFVLDSAWDAGGRLSAQRGGRAIRGLSGAVAAQRAGLAADAARPIARSYAWDRADAPTAIVERLWGEAAFAYDGNGQVTQARFGARAERFAYDPARNLAGVAVSGPGVAAEVAGLSGWSNSPGGVVRIARGPNGERLALTHDACGRVVERRLERAGFRPQVWRYRWDGLDRLVGCTTPEGEVWTYGYDPFGRRLWKRRELSEAERAWVGRHYPSQADTHPVVDRGAHYLEPRRPEPVAPWADLHAPDLPPIIGTAFSWDGDVVAEEAPLDVTGHAHWDLATRWVHAPGGFVPLAREAWTPAGRRLSYVVTDHLGTPRELVDEDGAVAWAARLSTWGVVLGVKAAVPAPANDDGDGYGGPGGIGSAAPARVSGNLALRAAPEEAAFACPIRFQGQWADAETGLHYNRHRHYDPVAGQYVSPDPIGLEGGDRPQGYVERPGVWTDPLGLAHAAPAASPSPKGGVYVLKDGNGNVVRSGRTNDLARRRQEHLRDSDLGRYEFEEVYRTDIYSEQRGLEQHLHDTYNPPLNKISPISPSNPNYNRYIDSARNYLDGII